MLKTAEMFPQYYFFVIIFLLSYGNNEFAAMVAT